jgi:hypothetical protein
MSVPRSETVLTLQRTVVTMYTICFNSRAVRVVPRVYEYLCVLCDSHIKSRFNSLRGIKQLAFNEGSVCFMLGKN